MTTFKNLLNSILDPLIAQKHFVLSGIVVLLAVVGSLVTYKVHVTSREQAAQKTFSECLEEYYKIMNGDKSEQWQEVERAFALGYERHKSANLAPYFLAFQAEALVQQKKQPEAIALMDTLLSSLSHSSPLYANYATKRALMKLDLADDAEYQKIGLQELTLLAHDKNNNAKDLALFYLGYYFWSNNDFAGAKKEWTELTELNQKEAKYPSVWAQLAQMKLQQLA